MKNYKSRNMALPYKYLFFLHSIYNFFLKLVLNNQKNMHLYLYPSAIQLYDNLYILLVGISFFPFNIILNYSGRITGSNGIIHYIPSKNTSHSYY